MKPNNNTNKNERKWYLLAYDIREPRRLQRTYYYVKKKGVGLQRSVFLVKADASGIKEIKAGIKQRVFDKADDVRLYPVRHPGTIWAAGCQTEKINSLYAPRSPKDNKKSPGVMDRIRLLFSRDKR